MESRGRLRLITAHPSAEKSTQGQDSGTESPGWTSAEASRSPVRGEAGALLSSLSDEALLLEFRTGRDEAFDVLYRRYRLRVLRWLRGMLGSESLADEVYNTTMFRIYGRLPECQEPGQFKRYLFKAAYNSCLNARRREQNLGRTHAEGRTWGGALDAGPLGTDPEARIEDRQLLLRSRELLERLPEDKRAALLLFHEDGLTYLEIADILGKPVGTVRWLIHEARATMAEYLKRELQIRR